MTSRCCCFTNSYEAVYYPIFCNRCSSGPIKTLPCTRCRSIVKLGNIDPDRILYYCKACKHDNSGFRNYVLCPECDLLYSN